MRRNLLTILKGLLFTVLVSCAVLSCENEKPFIVFPEEPVIIRSVESLYSDTITFNEGEYVTLSLRTTPNNLLKGVDKKDIQIDTATTNEKYSFATINKLKSRNNGIWDIEVRLEYGMNSGDVIRPKICLDDTIIYASPVVLKMIPKPIPIDYSLNITSDYISAFESGKEATVYLRTVPWNIFMPDANANAVLTFTDTLGGIIDNVTLDSTKFMPDSTWAVKIKVTDDADSTFVRFKMAVSDTTLTTKTVQIKKVAFFNIRRVNRYGGIQLNIDNKTNEFSYCFPTTTDFSSQRLIFFHNGDKITLGDSVLEGNGYHTLNVSKPITVSVWKYDLHKEYTIKLTNTGLPVVRITASNSYEDAVKIMRRDTWEPGNKMSSITMRIELPDGTVDYEGSISLKGRGNQTWSDFDKKPFAIKLDEKAKILGMPKNKRWILLANIKDRTLLRNDIALWIAHQTEMPYNVRGEFVELVWNGKHLGNYYLCEQARIDNQRINIKDPDLVHPEKGGFFMAIDAFLGYNKENTQWADKGDDIGFWTSLYNLPYTFKDPDEKELKVGSTAYNYMYDYVSKMEKAINKAGSDNHEWKDYLDPNSAVDFALIQEVVMNHDSYNTWPHDGPKSTYIYKDADGPICFGPMWDFDYHTFTLYEGFDNNNAAWTGTENQRLYQWEILKMTNKGGKKYYFADLKRDPQFKALLIERWNKYKGIWKNGFEDYVDRMAEKIRVSESYNYKMWGCPSRQNGDWNLTFDQAVQAVKTAFQKRWKWIDDNIGKL